MINEERLAMAYIEPHTSEKRINTFSYVRSKVKADIVTQR